ncbi:MAG TPA: acetyl-CoA carboxylase, carboxyltransferase subunit beta [Polyangia bacterium]|nr:acetyl-CoA carboxylase, carboxyltransferase subunit beta [Polyangia bacterium]
MAWWSRTKDKKGAAETGKKRSVPSGLFQKCDECGQTVESAKVKASLWCCPLCGQHFVLPTEERIKLVVDEGSFEEYDQTILPEDPLEFRDSKRYADRIRAAQKQVGTADAFRDGMARIEGRTVAVGFFVFEFMGGSMGSVVGEKITEAIERCIDKKVPLIIVSCSGGARMQEGILSLMQMAKTVAALGRLREAGLPYISVLLHPTTGGVAASFAMLGDVIVAEPKALIGFAGPRVIEQTIRQKLPEGFQRSEFLLEHGMVDLIVERKRLREKLGELVALLGPREQVASA